MILLDLAPFWMDLALSFGQFLIITAAVVGIILIADKLIRKAISKNKEE